MKRLAMLLLLTCVLSTPVLAGDVPSTDSKVVPPKSNPVAVTLIVTIINLLTK
jgi:hypothetical protein